MLGEPADKGEGGAAGVGKQRTPRGDPAESAKAPNGDIGGAKGFSGRWRTQLGESADATGGTSGRS